MPVAIEAVDLPATPRPHQSRPDGRITFCVLSIGLWAVVNNAGVPGKSGPSEFHTRADFQETLDVNLLGVIDVTNTFLPLVKRSRGRIINTSSMAGRLVFPVIPAYNISKWGVEIYSDCIRYRVDNSIYVYSLICSQNERNALDFHEFTQSTPVNRTEQPSLIILCACRIYRPIQYPGTGSFHLSLYEFFLYISGYEIGYL